jgi:dinuclear metal center YbgI/SA1388 family protein
MVMLADVVAFLERFAPPQLAEDWDNVGLLAGDPRAPVRRLMTCLTITPATADEAVQQRAELIVSHHPLPLRPTRRFTTETTQGRLLWQLLGARIAIYSPHTGFDSASSGINQRLADMLALHGVVPLQPRGAANAEQAAGGSSANSGRGADSAAACGAPSPAQAGAGRYGELRRAETLRQFARRIKRALGQSTVQIVGDPQRRIRRVAVACGSAGELLHDAIRLQCDCFVLGETRFHTCLEAEAQHVALVLTGHYASERFAVEQLALVLAEQFPQVHCWASRQERDPLRWV